MKRQLIRSFRLFSVVLGTVMIIGAQDALACPVCYGASDSPMADGVNASIVFLLGVTGAVLSGVVAFFLYMRRRTKHTLNSMADFPRSN